LTEEYPEILTPDNIWIVGITQKPSTKEYYLVFYDNLYTPLDIFIRTSTIVSYMNYADFDEIKEIGSGCYRTVYTAKYKRPERLIEMPEIVVLKRFKCFDQTPRLFITEVSNLR